MVQTNGAIIDTIIGHARLNDSVFVNDIFGATVRRFKSAFVDDVLGATVQQFKYECIHMECITDVDIALVFLTWAIIFQ